MVLQRIQTLYLLIAAIMMAVFTFLPVIQLTNDSGIFLVGAVTTCGINISSLILLALDLLIVVLAVITIFLYKNLKLQIKLAGILILLVVALLGTVAVMAIMQKGISIAILQWPIAFPFLALVMIMLAQKGMKHDKKLLSDSERIR